MNFTARTPAEEPNKCTNTSVGAASFNYRESDTDLEWTCAPGVYDFGDGFTASSSCSLQVLTSALFSPALTTTSSKIAGEATTTTSQAPAESTTSNTEPDAASTTNSATTSTAPEATGSAGRLQGDSSFQAIAAAVGAGVVMLAFGH